MSDELDPAVVACPKCDVGRGEVCEKPDGTPAAKPHADRVKSAKAEAAKRAATAVPDAVTAPRWRRVYRACRAELERRGDWSSLAAEQLLSMTLNMEHADTARATAARDPLIMGSNNNKRSNPLWTTAHALDGQALAVAKALRLTPDTRGASAPPADTVPDEPEADDGDEFADLDELAKRRAADQGRRR